MNAGIAQLVEHDLAKVGFASSSLVSRSSSKTSASSGCLAERPEEFGALTKRLCSGLQIRLVRFDSGTRLHFFPSPDGESVDTRDLNPSAFALCGFKSRSGYHGKDKNKIKAISSVVKPPSGGFLCLQLVVTPSLIFNHQQSHSKVSLIRTACKIGAGELRSTRKSV